MIFPLANFERFCAGQLILGAVFYWTFGVSVDEQWFKYGEPHREMGGWLETGIYRTRAECERERVKWAFIHVDDSHWYRYKPHQCFRKLMGFIE